MLQTTYLTPSAPILFYEMLDISIIELETKRFFKVTWLGNTVKEEVYIYAFRDIFTVYSYTKLFFHIEKLLK